MQGYRAIEVQGGRDTQVLETLLAANAVDPSLLPCRISLQLRPLSPRTLRFLRVKNDCTSVRSRSDEECHGRQLRIITHVNHHGGATCCKGY